MPPAVTRDQFVASPVQNEGKLDHELDPESALPPDEARGYLSDASTIHEPNARCQLHRRGSVGAPIHRAVGPPAISRISTGVRLSHGQCRLSS